MPPTTSLKIPPSRLRAVAGGIVQNTTNPVLQASVVKCFAAWVKKWPTDPWTTLAVEKEFALPLKDLRGRSFWFVGKRDYDGKDNDGPFLGEYKTHRGPWRKKMTVQRMIDNWFDGWKLNLQAAMYLYAMQKQYGHFPKLRYLVRVAVKPGIYNPSAFAFQRWFQYHPKVWKALVEGFFGTVTEMNDAAAQNNYPMNDMACINRYGKECPYRSLCEGQSKALVQLFPYAPHLSNVEALQPVAPWYDVSSVRLYRECPQKWYKERVKPRLSPAKSLALEEGSAFHAGMEILYAP